MGDIWETLLSLILPDLVCFESEKGNNSRGLSARSGPSIGETLIKPEIGLQDQLFPILKPGLVKIVWNC